MEEDAFSKRLKALEDRMNAAETGPGSNTAGAQGKFTQSSLAWRMVTELVAGMLLGLAIGFGLDSLIGTKPLFLILFVLLGFAAGIRTMMRTADEVRRKKAEGALLHSGDKSDGPAGRNSETGSGSSDPQDS